MRVPLLREEALMPSLKHASTVTNVFSFGIDYLPTKAKKGKYDYYTVELHDCSAGRIWRNCNSSLAQEKVLRYDGECQSQHQHGTFDYVVLRNQIFYKTKKRNSFK